MAFVATRLLPAVGEGESKLKRLTAGTPLEAIPAPGFFTLLLSVLLFYGFYRMIKSSRRRQQESNESSKSALLPFWIHQSAYAAVNVIIGALLVRQVQDGWPALLLFFVAKGSALLMLDHAFFDDHGKVYDRVGRWLVAAAVPVGALLELTVQTSDVAAVLMKAVLGGAVILNVLAEEVPPGRRSSFAAFLAGAVAYATLVVLVG